MKILIWAAILAILAGAISLAAIKYMENDDMAIGMACGNPRENTVGLDVSVAPLIVAADPPDLDELGNELWNDWVVDHFKLQDEAGQPVPMTRSMQSPLISELKTGGLQEFFLHADLTPGKTYTLEYIRVKNTPERYSNTFTAGDIPFIRKVFKRVK